MSKSVFAFLCLCAITQSAAADILSDVLAIGRQVAGATGVAVSAGIPNIGKASPAAGDEGLSGSSTLEAAFAGVANCTVRDHFYDASTQPATVPGFLRKTGGKPTTVNETANFRVTDSFYGLPISEVRLTYLDMPKYGVVFDVPAKAVQVEFAKRHGGKFELTAKFRDGSIRKLENISGGRSYMSCWYPMGD